MYNSEYCHETLHTLKYEFSIKEFMSLKENIDILNLYKVSSDLDEINEMNRESKNG